MIESIHPPSWLLAELSLHRRGPFFYEVLRYELSKYRSLGLTKSLPVMSRIFQKQSGLRFPQTRWRHPHRYGRGIYRNAPQCFQNKADTQPRLNGYSLPALKTVEISDYEAIYPKRTAGSRIKKATGALGSYYSNVKRVHLKPRSTDTPQNGPIREGRFYK